MHYWYSGRTKPFAWLIPVMALALVLGIACSSAAEQEADTGASAPAPAAEQQPAPTAIPQAAAEPEPAMTEVSSGRVTLMLGGFGAEVFDNTVGNLAKEPRKHLHGNLTSWDRIDGQMEIVPGIATKWELANGGNTLIYTIMEGASSTVGQTSRWMMCCGPSSTPSAHKQGSTAAALPLRSPRYPKKWNWAPGRDRSASRPRCPYPT